MIDVAELLGTPQKQGNVFSSDAYVNGETELGLIENRFGSRLVALPETLIQAIDSTLQYEIGGAKTLVQEQYGRWWGRTFYRRFQNEVQSYYEKPLNELTMIDFIQCLKQCWISYGWGTISINVDAYQQGYLVVILTDPPSSLSKDEEGNCSCAVEAGFLSGFLGQLTQQDLSTLEIPCQNSESTFHFILGLPERLKPISALAEEGYGLSTIMERLCEAS